MFRISLFFCMIYMVLPIHAQGIVRQQGYVRTVGRPGNKAGQRLSGVVLKVSGQHNMVKSGKDGKFALAFNGLREGKDAFSFTSVRLAGYDLQEKETIGRRYAISTTIPVEVVLVPQALKREIEEKVRRTVEYEYQKKLRCVEQLRHMDATHYQEALRRLEEEFDKRDRLVEAMVERYASTDYAHLDEQSAHINQCIEAGELERADSLINAQNLTRLEAEHAALRTRTSKLRDDLVQNEKAEDASARQLIALYEAKRDINIARFENDSAEFYWNKILDIDSTNVERMLEAGEFMRDYSSNRLWALMLFENALMHSIADYGPQSVVVARCYNDLALYYKGGLNLQMWQKYIRDAVDALLDVSSVEDCGNYLAWCFNNIGDFYTVVRNFTKAKDAYVKSLDFNEIYVHSSVLEAMDYDGLGSMCSAKLADSLALTYYVKAFDIRKNAFGELHSSVARSYMNMGNVSIRLGEVEKGMAYYAKALSINLKTVGDAHLQTARNYMLMGFAFKDQGDDAKAVTHLEEALSSYGKGLYGENNMYVLAIYNALSDLYARQDDPVKLWNSRVKISEITKAINAEIKANNDTKEP